MRVLLTSPLGLPSDSKTWSAAPFHLLSALEIHGIDVYPFNSSPISIGLKAAQVAVNLVRGYRVQDISRFKIIRSQRSKLVVQEAIRCKADAVLCTSTLDVPWESEIPYYLWIDNTWHLYRRTPVATSLSTRAIQEIDRLDRDALLRSRHVFTFSSHVREDTIRHYGVSPDNVSVVGCGCGFSGFLRPEKHYASGHILFVAKHLFKEKGGNLALDAFRLVLRHRPQTKFVIVGNQEVVNQCQDMEGVTAYGYVDRAQLRQLFNNASILLQPMIADPWGQVYLEAMLSKAMIVGLCTGALPELTENGKLGMLVKDANPIDLADAVLKVYNMTEGDLDYITDMAYQRVVDNYTWDRVAARIVAHF